MGMGWNPPRFFPLLKKIADDPYLTFLKISFYPLSRDFWDNQCKNDFYIKSLYTNPSRNKLISEKKIGKLGFDIFE